MANKLTLKFKDTFPDFVSKLKDLSQIDDTIKIKITSDKILMYSMINNENAVLALKTYNLNTLDYLEKFDKEETYDFILTSAGKFVKNLNFFNSESSVKFEINFKQQPDNEDVMHIRSAQFSNQKLKVSCIGGEQYKIKDLNSNIIEARLNPKLSKWGFKISKQDFSDVKKLSSINNEEKILNINVNNKTVTLNELSKWELVVDEIEHKNEQLIFGKKYLSNINDNHDFIEFKIFETFILIKDDISNLMLSFEQDFSDDEN